MKYFYISLFSIVISLPVTSQIAFTRIDLDYILDGIEDVTTFDLSEDGDLDLVAASSNDDRVTLFRQVGFYDPLILTSSLNEANVIVTHDLDTDGDEDIIAAGNGKIYWWQNNNGSFSSTKEIVSLGNTFMDFVVFDIDEDGDMDIVSVAFSTAAGPGFLSLWQNENLNFTQVILSENSIDGRSIRVTDLDIDGDLDFVIGEGLGNKIAFWSNEGNLNYVKSTITGCTVCVSMNLGDVDADGDLDIVASSFTGDYLVLMVNNGQLNFDRKVFETSYDGPDEILLHDLDVDGDMDIVACFYNEDLLAYYEQIDSLEFIRRIIDPDFRGARDIHISDLDNDGDPDILGASLSLDRMIIWVNDLMTSSTSTLPKVQPLNIFPNPALNEIQILNSDVTHNTISIHTIDGRSVLISSNINKIDISTLSTGTYVLTVKEGKYNLQRSCTFIKN